MTRGKWSPNTVPASFHCDICGRNHSGRSRIGRAHRREMRRVEWAKNATRYHCMACHSWFSSTDKKAHCPVCHRTMTKAEVMK